MLSSIEPVKLDVVPTDGVASVISSLAAAGLGGEDRCTKVKSMSMDDGDIKFSISLEITTRKGRLLVLGFFKQLGCCDNASLAA